MTPPRSAPASSSPAQIPSVDDAPGAFSTRLSLTGKRTYELKFLLAEAKAKDIERWALERMLPDPHAEPALGYAYRVSSLYLDTPRLEVYHRIPPHHRRKLRLRSYGSSPDLFLEQKTRRGDRVRKRRTQVPLADWPGLAGSTRNTNWAGGWFLERIHIRNLRPTLQVACVRSAFVGGAAAPVRLTLDRHLGGVANTAWQPVPWRDRALAIVHQGKNGQAAGGSLQPEALTSILADGSCSLLTEQVVLELKYQEAMPALFKGLLEEFALVPCPISKYRLAVRALNPAAAPPQVS